MGNWRVRHARGTAPSVPTGPGPDKQPENPTPLPEGQLPPPKDAEGEKEFYDEIGANGVIIPINWYCIIGKKRQVFEPDFKDTYRPSEPEFGSKVSFSQAISLDVTEVLKIPFPAGVANPHSLTTIKVAPAIGQVHGFLRKDRVIRNSTGFDLLFKYYKGYFLYRQQTYQLSDYQTNRDIRPYRDEDSYVISPCERHLDKLANLSLGVLSTRLVETAGFLLHPPPKSTVFLQSLNMFYETSDEIFSNLDHDKESMFPTDTSEALKFTDGKIHLGDVMKKVKKDEYMKMRLISKSNYGIYNGTPKSFRLVLLNLRTYCYLIVKEV